MRRFTVGVVIVGVDDEVKLYGNVTIVIVIFLMVNALLKYCKIINNLFSNQNRRTDINIKIYNL